MDSKCKRKEEEERKRGKKRRKRTCFSVGQNEARARQDVRVPPLPLSTHYRCLFVHERKAERTKLTAQRIISFSAYPYTRITNNRGLCTPLCCALALQCVVCNARGKAWAKRWFLFYLFSLSNFTSLPLSLRRTSLLLVHFDIFLSLGPFFHNDARLCCHEMTEIFLFFYHPYHQLYTHFNLCDTDFTALCCRYRRKIVRNAKRRKTGKYGNY